MSKTRVVIIGGGFGGVKCAQTLARQQGAEQLEVVLFDRQNHLVFSPLLAEVVGSSLSSLDVVVPLRQLLPGVFCRIEEVRRIDLASQEVEYLAENCNSARMGFEHLVIACGSVTNLNVMPGMADHSFALKTVADATHLRSQLITQMELAEVCSEAERRQWHLTVIVVGAGYSGVEAAGEINDLMRESARYFHNWSAQDVRVILVHSREQILPEISPGLRDFARRKMEKAGVQMRLQTRVMSATPEGVAVEGGPFIRGATIVCTIGSSAAPVVAGLDVAKEKGRLSTEPDMRLKAQSSVWAIGDCAAIVNAHNGQLSPTTGQFAERQGRQCALNILRVQRHQATRPFRFKLLGELCSIGGHSAVADLFGLHLSGFLAWFAWRGIYLFKLPTWGRRLQVGFDWAMLLAFPRDLAHERLEQTDRVAHAHYDAGDYIFRRGEAPSSFYVLEAGEVEVLRPQNGSQGEVVAVLGPGSFFGERALLGNRPRVMSIRARTPVEVLVMGRNVFTQISGALAPLRDALAQALNHRAVDMWKDRPQVYELLRRTPVSQLMEPVPQPLLSPTATQRQVGQAFVDHGNEFFFVSSDGHSLEGVVTITDLIRGRHSARGNGHGNGSPANLPLSEFMTPHPVSVAMQDDCALAATAMREYRLKSLPVVVSKEGTELAGCLRVRKLMAFVLKEIGPAQAQPTETPPGKAGNSLLTEKFRDGKIENKHT